MQIKRDGWLMKLANMNVRVTPKGATDVSFWKVLNGMILNGLLIFSIIVVVAKLALCLAYTWLVWILAAFGTPIHYERMGIFWGDCYDAGSVLTSVLIFGLVFCTILYIGYRALRNKPSNFWLFRTGDRLVQKMNIRVSVVEPKQKSRPIPPWYRPMPGEKDDRSNH